MPKSANYTDEEILAARQEQARRSGMKKEMQKQGILEKYGIGQQPQNKGAGLVNQLLESVSPWQNAAAGALQGIKEFGKDLWWVRIWRGYCNLVGREVVYC